MQPFWDWLIGEAGAGWIIGLASVLWALYIWRRRERAPRVIVQEVKRTKLLNIHPSQREKLSVFYTDTAGNQVRIQELEQKEIVIYNNGSKDIFEPLELTLRFQPLELTLRSPGRGSKQGFQGFWRLVFDDETCTSEPLYDDTQNVCLGTRVKLPYLNSYPVHHHHVRAYLISDQRIKLELLKRVGRGWSAHFVGLRRLKELQQRVARMIERVSATLGLLALGAVGFSVMRGFRDPTMWVMFNPTPENIEVAINYYRDLLEALRTSGIIGYWKVIFQIPGWRIFVLFIVISALAIIPYELREEIGRLISLRYLGIQPISRFEQ